jgi:hypothetical protein
VKRLTPVLLALLLLTGCTDGGDAVPDKDSQDAALQQRPTLEQEQERLTSVRDQVRDALGSRLGLSAWSERDNGNAAGCADYPDSAGYTAFLPSLLLPGGVPDEQWAQAVEVVEEVAGTAGFGTAETVVDQPGQHQVVLRGERESRLSFGSTENATLRLEAGCHLTESDHS